MHNIFDNCELAPVVPPVINEDDIALMESEVLPIDDFISGNLETAYEFMEINFGDDFRDNL
jgi:hypothetical protein